MWKALEQEASGEVLKKALVDGSRLSDSIGFLDLLLLRILLLPLDLVSRPFSYATPFLVHPFLVSFVSPPPSLFCLAPSISLSVYSVVYVCVYVLCVYVCVWVCVHACVCACVCECMRMRMIVGVSACVCACACVCVYVCVCV